MNRWFAALLLGCSFSAHASELANISTRGKVLTGDEVMIAGFIIQGAGSKTVVVNVAGPSLAGTGIANLLANPTLTLVRSSDSTIIATNDDWQRQTFPADVAAIQASGFQPNHSLEPAIMATLQPGAYTAIAEGVSGGTGVAVVGVFTVSTNTTTSVAGSWHGTYEHGQTDNWAMTLSQSGSNVSGSISCNGVGFSNGPFSIAGQFSAGNLSLNLNSGGCVAALNATVSSDTLTGTYSSSNSGACMCFSGGSGTWQGTRP